VQEVVRRIGGDQARMQLGSDGEWLTVTASAKAGGAVGPLIPWDLSASAKARQEVPGK
jgi:hypothetical protein